jgi:hypothetical protein
MRARTADRPHAVLASSDLLTSVESFAARTLDVESAPLVAPVQIPPLQLGSADRDFLDNCGQKGRTQRATSGSFETNSGEPLADSEPPARPPTRSNRSPRSVLGG